MTFPFFHSFIRSCQPSNMSAIEFSTELQRQLWFRRVIDMYQRPFFFCHPLQSLVEFTYLHDFDRIEQETMLICPNDHVESCIEHVTSQRIPVFFGRPRTDMWDENKWPLPELWGESPHAYAILSPTEVYKTAQMDIEQGDSSFWISALHLWAPNFESRHTLDWRSMVTISQEGDVIVHHDRYRSRIVEMTRIMDTAIGHLLSTITCAFLEIRLPRVGLGNFLNALDVSQQTICEHTWLDVIHAWASQLDHSRIRVVYCDIRDLQLDEKYAYLNVHRERNLFAFGERPDVHVLLVNAWDPVSFIGNGGAEDRSIDGMVGGGACNLFWSSAYLSNVMFAPQQVNRVLTF